MSTVTMAQDRMSFNEDIRPILNQHCVACHGGVKQAGDLSFVYAQDADYLVEPGQPDESYLIDRVTSEDPEERMPPPGHGRALDQQEIAKLRQWIQEGGQWGEHWAFSPPRKIDAPPSAEDHWSLGKVDRFVWARLQQAGLAPEPEASPERWLRRVTLDLTGLPPTLEQRLQFLDDLSKLAPDAHESAYEQVVDRLLQSPAFGPRWASVWLDVVRYADSKGLGIDGRRTIWKYRDWVIRAFNADTPFDEFTIKQIAGDLLPEPSIDDLVATACNRLTQTCEEGGTDDEQFRVEAVIDRVNTTMTAWQGLTFGCVQCHAHPYDPIRHDEYYQFMAFFNNTADSDLESEAPHVAAPLDDSQNAEALEIDRQLRALQLEDWKEAYELLRAEKVWLPLNQFSATTNNSTRVVAAEVDGVAEYQTRGTVAKETTVVLDCPLPETVEQITALRFTGLPRNEDAARMYSEWGFVLSHVEVELAVDGEDAPRKLELETLIADEPQPLLDPDLSLAPKNKNGFGAYSRIHFPRSVALVLRAPMPIPAGSRLRVSLHQNVTALGAFPLVAHRGRLAISSHPAWTDWKDSKHRADRQVQQKQLRRRREAIPSVAIPIMRERPRDFARPNYVFDRGNFLVKSDSVAPQIPGFLPALNRDAPTRLDMARWLVSSENPLTARVAVNRFWAQLFGTGIVETQEDFGSSGDPPSHPRLLDDLAARFRSDMKWSVKELLRELTLSATYRQRATVDSKKLEADPRNRLLSRGPRTRLPAETLRDQALAISGLLSHRSFGAPVHPPIPEGVWSPFQGNDPWDTPEKGDPDRYRRTIYTYTKRTIQFPMLASFDAPTREFCAPRRLPSNTPLQALMMLNDAMLVEAGEALAIRMQQQATEPGAQIRHGFLLATCRDPQPKELDRLVALYQSECASLDSQEESDRLAALSTVAMVLLNLDEVLSK